MKCELGHEAYSCDIRRPPRGGRGLKFLAICDYALNETSPPSRGAWIEITKTPTGKTWETAVAPLAGGVD